MSSELLSAPKTTVPKIGCGYAVCVLLVVIGGALILAARSAAQGGDTMETWVLGGIGAALVLTGIGLVTPMQRAVARARERLQRELERPNEPWTWDLAWVDPAGIPQSGRRQGRALLIVGIMVTLISLPVVFALPKEFGRGNYGILVALLFPLLGLGLLGVAFTDWLRRRKYGLARFVPGAVPIPLGGELAGMVLVDRAVVPASAGRVSLDCHRTSVTRSGGKRRQQDEVIAHSEREIASGDWNTTAAESRLFVQLPVRGGEPTSMAAVSVDWPVHEWRLRVDVPTAGADFVAEFVLPVFLVAGGAAADASGRAVAPAPANLRAALGSAGIREEPQPLAKDGVALLFPAGQGRSLVAGPLVMALVFGGTTVVLLLTPVPKVIALFVGLFALLPALVVKALAGGGGERVWFEGGDVVTERRGKQRRSSVADVQEFDSSRSVGVGTRQFYRIIARMRPTPDRRLPRRFELASLVRGDEAADAVVAWLRERRQ